MDNSNNSNKNNKRVEFDPLLPLLASQQQSTTTTQSPTISSDDDGYPSYGGTATSLSTTEHDDDDEYDDDDDDEFGNGPTINLSLRSAATVAKAVAKFRAIALKRYKNNIWTSIRTTADEYDIDMVPTQVKQNIRLLVVDNDNNKRLKRKDYFSSGILSCNKLLIFSFLVP